MSQGKAKQARLAAAESNLRELGELLDASLGVERDICRRARDGDSSGNLKRQLKSYARIIGRVLEAYFLAVDEYLAAVSEALRLKRGNPGSNGSPPLPGGTRRDRSVI
jgi:hypothetical protein